ncbi:LSU ribosomal protein L29P [Geoalkalibacter ferrihydriticus]|uniref:Large ribosomal subunit protein uL29 n=2 Tax=Geoalkalibacter ferrihydriticus TaxID=392333 RepID=A0A0C2HJC3_9BACT|nr:50S ribosomal protein L29 [Geoalkalibacter ferrihydriticus]KIH77136.1 50S ribosomal protein L29 [Geoalkalibacter ferrihydriticus DSM 17813]SDL32948.1 LSU ribosomal protein L29P [Geoalkalibacter ferrihydriticus]
MKGSDLRGLGIAELEKKNAELSQELFNLRFQLHTGHLEKSSRISQVKKDIARVKTVLAQKQG